MLLLYRLLFPAALLAALPFFLPRMFRRGGYARHFGHRLGLVQKMPPPRLGEHRIWVHAVSVGELQALGPMLDLLQEDQPSIQIVMTTTTSTGYALAQRKYGPRLAWLGYFPLDFWPISRRVWNCLQPDLCILTEGEIWPEHLHQARTRGVPTVLINARLSERSYRRWQSLPHLLRAPLTMLTMVVACSEEDGWHFSRLGVPKERIVVSGNLKLDIVPAPILDPAELNQLIQDLGYGPDPEIPAGQPRPLVLAGASTWPGEERMLLGVVQRLAKQGLACRLLLIPRHAERRDELRQMLDQGLWRVHFRSTGPADGPVDVTVADTTGEMILLLQAADVVFMGKSMDPHRGGQNPIEAAALGKAVVFGPNMQNFRSIVASMVRANAARMVKDEAELYQALEEMLRNQTARNALGWAARSWQQDGKGASRRTVEIVNRFLRP